MYFMKDESGHAVDVHVFEYDDNGKNIYGVMYPFGSLTGKGVIDGQEVDCVSPEWMFKFKTSYEPKDNQDVWALSEKFGFDLPAKYHRP
jgi:lincosamide nucleotidyltransferase A/C/D/E